MTKTIVMNTLTGAVSEYDNFNFQSITPTHAGGASGMYALTGTDDAGTPITAEIRSGVTGGEKMLSLGNAFVAVKGGGDGVFIVQGRNDAWEYPVQARASGIASVKSGRGIRESRLGFGYRNAEGADFHLDRIDIEVFESKNRRV